MTMPKINKNMLLIAGLVIVAIAGYFTFFRKSDTSNQLLTVETNQSSSIGQELIVELNRLKSLRSVGKEIFSDPVFVSLKDYTQKIYPQPFGRSNPFAPIGSE
jgi:LPXTG-motif cell wall-anchored protein